MLNHIATVENNISISKGDILWVDFGQSEGSIQNGVRPALVIQNDVGNHYSPTTIVIPITTKKKRNLPTHIEITAQESGLKQDSVLLTEQIRTINKTQILSVGKKLPLDLMNRVDAGVIVSLSLNLCG